MVTRHEVLEKLLLQYKFATDPATLRSELEITKQSNPYKLPEYWSDYEKLVHIDLYCRIARRKDEVNTLLQDLSRRGIERENQSVNQLPPHHLLHSASKV